jgi:hypothetical protein
MQLTAHFTLEEFCHSQTADRLGLNNQPDALTVQHLMTTAHVLEQVRTLTQSPVVISSGFRAPLVNRACGGAPSSQHLTGHASDITAPGFGTPRKLMEAIYKAKIPYDQLILEYASLLDPSRGWVHISFGERNRRQALVIDHAGTREYA